LLSLLVGPSALAQADDAGQAVSAPESPREPEAAPGAAAKAEAVPPGPASSIGLEHLRGAAFPEPQPRGIVGGSLWMTMQGLQWPYMPGPAGTTTIGFSGQVWVDTSYRKVDSGVPDTDPSLHEWKQQSRLVLRSTPTYNAGDDWFVQGQGELVLTGAAPPDAAEFLVADDLYLRVGKWNRFDLSAGRFQGWEVYHLGMGLDLNTVERDGARTDGNQPVGIYGVTYYWDRPNGPGRIAAHYYATDSLRFELMGQLGSSPIGLNALGIRPVAILDLGVFKAKVGAEYGKDTPRQQADNRKESVRRSGVGGSLQAVLQPWLEAGLAAAYGNIDSYNAQGVLDAGRSTTTYSYGGFANVRVAGPLIVGGGLDYTHENNLKVDLAGKHDIRTHLQTFGALQYALWEQLYVKAVVAYANAHVDPESDPPPIAEFRNKALSGRLRFQYLF
jgi:hypothetical protein